MMIPIRYRGVIARNGIEALDGAHREQPDLIILDIMLPGQDGFEVARALHRTPDTATIPILMVTARSAVADKSLGYDSGADIYLTKPVQQMDLQANIKVLLAQRKARKYSIANQAYVVGVMSARGGSGVSTLALNTAIMYAKKYNEKVIAAELRPGLRGWSEELDLPQVFGLAELLKMRPEEITPTSIDGLLASTDFRVRLLLAPNLSQEPDYAGNSIQYEAIVSGLSQLASLVVLDMGAYFSDAVMQILLKCNEVVVVTEPQQLSIIQNARLLDLIHKAYTFSSAMPINIVSVNRTRSDMILTVSQMEETLHRPIALGIPPATELSVYSARQHMPMAVVQPENVGVQQFGRLAEIIKKHRENA